MNIESVLLKELELKKQTKKVPLMGDIKKRHGLSDYVCKNVVFFLKYADVNNSESETNEDFESIPAKPNFKESETKIDDQIKGSERNITTISAKIKSDKDALEYSKVDLTKWYVKDYQITSWEVTIGAKNTGTEKPETYTNYRVALKLALINKEELSIKEQAEQFKQFVKEYKPDYEKLSKIKKPDSNYMLEISCPDFHYGQLSWEPEVGENYDIKIAQKLWIEAMNYYAQIGKNNNVEKFLLPLGNDWFNVNSAANTTFAGTPQDEDCRWKKSFSTGWMLIVKGIDILLSVADVDIVIVPGNHDTERAYYMGEVIKAWYKDLKRVRIDNSPIDRKYYNYGNSLIGYTHGKDEKIQELPMIMALEESGLLAKTKYREFHIGHLHHDRRLTVDLVDNTSIKVRIMPSLVPLSVYSKNHAYMSVREAIGLLWDKNKGKIAEFSYYPNL